MHNNIEDIEVELLLAALYQRYHYDFRHYAKASIKRRLIQACNQLQFPTISALQDALLHEPSTLPQGMQAFGIAGGVKDWFASHPPLDVRIAALQNSA